jgi:hypothetical protein
MFFASHATRAAACREYATRRPTHGGHCLLLAVCSLSLFVRGTRGLHETSKCWVRICQQPSLSRAIRGPLALIMTTG